MGRKIPTSNKHKKLKAVDPFYKGERRNLLDKGLKKANCKPNKPDSQEVPKKMLEMFKFHQLLQDGKLETKQKRKKKKEFAKFYENPRDVIAGMPIFERLPGEDDAALLRRVGRLSRGVVEEFHLFNKHDKRSDTKILDDAEKNDRDWTDKKVASLTQGSKETSKSKQNKRKIYVAKKKERKRMKVENRKGDFDHLKDEIIFGEVSIQPPHLSSKPRKGQNSSSINKPGRKALLLKNVLNPKEVNTMKREINLSSSGVSGSTVDRTVKRKLLAVADRRKLDHERDSAVQAYRALKNRQRIRSKIESKLKAEAQLVKESLTRK